MGLRAVNNSADCYRDKSKKPIVLFAWENVQALRLRAKKEASAKVKQERFKKNAEGTGAATALVVQPRKRRKWEKDYIGPEGSKSGVTAAAAEGTSKVATAVEAAPRITKKRKEANDVLPVQSSKKPRREQPVAPKALAGSTHPAAQTFKVPAAKALPAAKGKRAFPLKRNWDDANDKLTQALAGVPDMGAEPAPKRRVGARKARAKEEHLDDLVDKYRRKLNHGEPSKWI